MEPGSEGDGADDDVGDAIVLMQDSEGAPQGGEVRQFDVC